MSKKRRQRPVAGSMSKTFARSSASRPPGVLVAGGHVVRDDVEDDGEPRGAEPPERLLAAALLGDAGRVDDVVAVRGAGARLERGREVEVADPERAQVRDELERVAEPEVLRQLEAVGREHERESYRIPVLTYPVVAKRADTQAVTIDTRSASDIYDRLTRQARPGFDPAAARPVAA